MLRFEVLGPLRAWRGVDPLELGPVKRQAVLAALLLRRGAVVSHGRLLDSVWGEEPPAGGHKVLATHVNSLRRVVDSARTPPAQSVIRSGKGWYRFVVDGVGLDTADLEERGDRALRAARGGDLPAAVDQLSDALALFRGEPLAGVPGPFAQEERERWEERRRTFRVEWLKCLVTLKRFGEALDDLSGLSSSDRYDEVLTGLRMRALYGRGRPSEALRTYEELRVRLRDELGTDPGEELRRVYEAVLHQDDSMLLRSPQAVGSLPRVDVVPAELPHDIPGFSGRSDELGVLHSLLGTESARAAGSAVVVSAIGGAAGVGKTALAVHWAHQSVIVSLTGSSTSICTASTTTGSPSNPVRPLSCCCGVWGSRRRRSPRTMRPREGVPDAVGRSAHARAAGQRGLRGAGASAAAVQSGLLCCGDQP